MGDVKPNNANLIDTIIFFLPVQICLKAVKYSQKNDHK